MHEVVAATTDRRAGRRGGRHSPIAHILLEQRPQRRGAIHKLKKCMKEAASRRQEFSSRT